MRLKDKKCAYLHGVSGARHQCRRTPDSRVQGGSDCPSPSTEERFRAVLIFGLLWQVFAKSSYHSLSSILSPTSVAKLEMGS